MAVAVSRGLFQGDAQGRFNPADGITRAQFSLVAYRAELRNLAVVQGIRFSGNHPDKTRVVIDFSSKPGDIVVHLNGSSVLTVDVSGAVAEGRGHRRDSWVRPRWIPLRRASSSIARRWRGSR